MVQFIANTPWSSGDYAQDIKPFINNAASNNYSADNIHNKLKAIRESTTKLNKCTQYLILGLLVLQTTVVLVFYHFLFVRIKTLEADIDALTNQAIGKQSQLDNLSKKVLDIRDECSNLFSMDCSILKDADSALKTTVEHNFLVNLDIDEDYFETDDDLDYFDRLIQDKFRRQRNTPDYFVARKKETRKNINISKQVAQQKITSKKFQTRLLCQKCKTGQNKPKREINKGDDNKLMAKDVVAAHFTGGLPEMFFKEEVVSGTIGPWFLEKKAPNVGASNDFKLEFKNSSVEVFTDGFYFIYAQVYYLSLGGSNSFSIVKRRNRGDAGEVLATCSNSGQLGKSNQEVSCFTATVSHLRRGDFLQIVEREMNRRVLFRDGQTYFGLMRMSSSNTS